MAISTSSIFHFTNSYETIISILEEGFRVTYCLEEYELGNGTVELGISMISFADIPLAQLNQSVSNYGSYCIGLSKEWAAKKHINPVLYMDQNSYLSQVFCDYLDLIQSKPDINVKYEYNEVEEGKVEIKYIGNNENEIALKMMNGLLTFIKNSNGTLRRRNQPEVPNFNFYAEREWRYVPSEQDFNEARFTYIPILQKKSIDDWRDKDGTKQFIPRLNLNFIAQDITHIIVSSEDEVIDLISKLKSQTHLFQNEGELELLFTKITTFDKLKSDY
jgi:Putative abortive phage resistance protein AbiGi, antitoxin